MIKIIDKFINTITILFIIIIGFFSIYNLYDLRIIEEEINESETINIINSSKKNIVNKNIIGFIKINNTIIDYPLLQGNNNTDYLSLNYKNKFSSSGSIFLDYRNDKDFNDDLNIIYGHNMSYKRMFSELENYKDNDYLNYHKKGILVLRNSKYIIDILLYREVKENDDIPYNLYLYKNNYNKMIINYFMNSDEKINKLLILSTCKKKEKNKRVILLAKLSKI